VSAQIGLDRAASPNRLIHRFDFDERGEGNLEDLPKYWVPFRPGGFPRFAYGEFDVDVGRAAPPSFYLASEGRNVAYQYIGPDTRVRASTDYRIEGYIWADRLRYARACLSAHFVDRRSRPLPATLVRSRFVGGPDESKGWAKVELYLPAAPEEAYTVGLNAWILQEPTWNTIVPTRRHITRWDVFGGAWFDDISIYALPRVDLSLGAPGNVLPPGQPKELLVLLADNEDAGVQGHLSITSSDGTLVVQQMVPVVGGADMEETRVPLEHLGPGIYEARLEITSADVQVLSRTLTFVLLGPLFRQESGLARPFGVVVDPRPRCDAKTELALLDNQGVRSAKFPVWTGLPEEPPGAGECRTTDRLLQGLAKRGFALTGVFFGSPPAIVRNDGAYPRPLISLLNEPPLIWKEHLAAVGARYAGVFHWWQVGADDTDRQLAVDEYATAIDQLREQMAAFVAVPMLGAATRQATEPQASGSSSDKLPAEQLSVTLGAELHPDWFASQIARFGSLGYQHLSVFIQSTPADQYHSLPRLADWAQRIISARHGGADTVFVPQTWGVRATPQGLLAEPTEEYLILRTIADVLADARPGQRVAVAPAVRCLAFHDGDSTVLAMWDPQAPPEGRCYAIQLGRAQRQIDLWGRTRRLERAEDGRQIVQLFPMPVLVDGIERWLIDFRSSLSLQPQKVESGVELLTHTLSMLNDSSSPIAGRGYLAVPESWKVTPRSFNFNLQPRRVEEFTMQIRYPHNAAAGKEDLLARITLGRATGLNPRPAADPHRLAGFSPGGAPSNGAAEPADDEVGRYSPDGIYFEIPLSVELGLTDLDVRGMAVVEGDNLVLRHTVTNRSSAVLNFRGSANVPGRQRQYRPFSGLFPGDTQTVEYRISGGANLVGSRVRLGLLELNDGPRRHNLELTVP
jgi:hypothetical protein